MYNLFRVSSLLLDHWLSSPLEAELLKQPQNAPSVTFPWELPRREPQNEGTGGKQDMPPPALPADLPAPTAVSTTQTFCSHLVGPHTASLFPGSESHSFFGSHGLRGDGSPFVLSSESHSTAFSLVVTLHLPFTFVNSAFITHDTLLKFPNRVCHLFSARSLTDRIPQEIGSNSSKLKCWWVVEPGLETGLSTFKSLCSRQARQHHLRSLSPRAASELSGWETSSPGFRK